MSATTQQTLPVRRDSVIEECVQELLAARRLSDLERRGLPALRRRLGLAALAVSVEVDGVPRLIAAGEAVAVAEIRRALGAAPGLTLCRAPRAGELRGVAIGAVAVWSLARSSSDREALQRLEPLVAAATANAVDFERLYRSAITDPLTGLYNRRHFVETLQRELDGTRRDARPAALLALDLDRFKPLNDCCGHAAGDAFLVRVAGVLQQQTRRSDVVARVGGDEFLVLATATSRRRAAALARRIERAVRALPAPAPIFSLMVSIGIAVARPRQNADALLAAADAAMYRRKRACADAAARAA